MRLRDVIAARSLAEWTERFAAMDACVEPVLNAAEVLNHPHTKARGMVVTVPKADGGEQRQVGSPFHFSRSRATYQHTGVKPGTHSSEVLAEIGYKPAEIDGFYRNGLLG